MRLKLARGDKILVLRLTFLYGTDALCVCVFIVFSDDAVYACLKCLWIHVCACAVACARRAFSIRLVLLSFEAE